ncbi:hypothetical protein NTE_03388 [Candidatus Nitrososphaera evergladensis SR1]|uniref:Uncharacterized protein n=1 Tax=Candidatus Nitrososphaera evergladensis SR1 TaxID=1459636 RepID=A0A075MUS5_9ARCH|nr:hypothetical protein NTE_03388 [Candidatus Nitrososphaera evergladensis SR1]
MLQSFYTEFAAKLASDMHNVTHGHNSYVRADYEED